MRAATTSRSRSINVGFAADTPNGLVVPVLKDADKKGVIEIAQETGELAKKARDGKLGPADMQGGCFSISSLGGIGGTAFTPIVNAPEVAILGVSKSAIKPVWDGKAFQPRLLLPLSLSYDHRVIDGAAAARFTSYLAQVLATCGACCCNAPWRAPERSLAMLQSELGLASLPTVRECAVPMRCRRSASPNQAAISPPKSRA
jgi:pyruvate/2-oxoglutarate dehydrogenase complex dihydrolipoamide acyltransferase (E2) component